MTDDNAKSSNIVETCVVIITILVVVIAMFLLLNLSKSPLTTNSALLYLSHLQCSEKTGHCMYIDMNCDHRLRARDAMEIACEDPTIRETLSKTDTPCK